MTWTGNKNQRKTRFHEERHPTEICGAAEPAKLDVTSDVANAEALTFAGFSDDDCPAEDSENSDEEYARTLKLFDGMTPEDTTRRWRHWESRASAPMTAPADDNAEHSAR